MYTMKRKSEEKSEEQVRKKLKDSRKTKITKYKTHLSTTANEESSVLVGFSHSKSETQPRKLPKKKPSVKKVLGQKNRFESHTKKDVFQKPDWAKMKAEVKTARLKQRVEKTGHEHSMRKSEEKSEEQVRKKLKDSRKTKITKYKTHLSTTANKEESSVLVGFSHSKSETQPRKLLKKKPSVKKFLVQKNRFGSHMKKGVFQKPNWAKMKAEVKTARLKRRVKKTGNEHYEMTVKCKQLWEKVRRRDCPKEERSKLLEQLFVLVKGQVNVVIYTHDMARVVHWLLKLGCEDIRMRLCEELCAQLTSLLQSKYASTCVKYAFKYAPSESRRHMIECIKGRVFKLLCHSIAGPVIEKVYSIWATAVERAQMRLELYGDLCSKYIQPDQHAHSIIECVSNDLRPAVVAATKANLEKLIDKKHMMASTLLHSVMLDFLRHCSENDRKEMLENLNPHLSELQNSKNGINIATLVVQNGTNKIKKNAVKSIKGHVKEIATSEHGYLLLMAIFDHVDDTVLVRKALIPELLADVVDIARNEYGRKVLLYIVAHKDPLFFHLKHIKTVEECVSSGTCKKDAAVKEKELLESVSSPLLEKIANDPVTWIGNPDLAMVSLAVLKSGSGDELTQALNNVANYACDKKSQVNYNNRMYHVVEHSTLHMVFKKLIQHDKQNLEKGLSRPTFSLAFVSNLTNGRLRNLLELNRGCFLLIGILEAGDKEAINLLKSKFTKEAENVLERQETTGAQVLIKKLKCDQSNK